MTDTAVETAVLAPETQIVVIGEGNVNGLEQPAIVGKAGRVLRYDTGDNTYLVSLPSFVNPQRSAIGSGQEWWVNADQVEEFGDQHLPTRTSGARVLIIEPRFAGQESATLLDHVGKVGTVSVWDRNDDTARITLDDGPRTGWIDVRCLQAVVDPSPEPEPEPEPEPVVTMSDEEIGSLLDALRSNTHDALLHHVSLIEIESLQRQIRQADEAVTTEREEFSRWQQDLIEDAMQSADDEGWCPVFDSAMETLGFPTRRRTEEINWRCTVTIEDAMSEDSVIEEFKARYNVESYEVESIEANDVDITVTVEVTGTREVNSGDCACEDVENEDIEDALPSWVNDNDMNWTMGRIYCDND